MTITQTVEIPADRRITLEVPREVPTGRAIIAFTPAKTETQKKIPISQFFGILSPNTYGNSVDYQRSLRDEWDD